ncbi:glycosyltransferase family 9 protein [Flavobacterium sp. MK4S-17]|uniref:glycosyltransferase family 9 protein n=1 Tax=Flavobacterium sp. MK4S-17 TaxID=2543737 RepID=UPI001F2443FE|nr:glycosyltransferase family 9 protein [Flavobacterium sp. MK4S-17]
MLLITPLVQEASRTFPDATIDIFVKGGVANVIFQNYTCIGQIFQLPKKHFSQLLDYLGKWFKLKAKKYDLVINVSPKSSSGRLATKITRAPLKLYGDMQEATNCRKDTEMCHIAKYPVHNLRQFLVKAGITPQTGEVPTINMKLSEEELRAGNKKLKELAGGDKPVISIFTFATGAKCYETDWWEKTYAKLKAEYPGYTIIEILPVENVSQINFKAPSFYSRDIREIASVIASTVLFIGADSGIMHLASASQTTVIGLFSLKNSRIYAPYGNNSEGIYLPSPDTTELFRLISSKLNG